MTEEEFKRILDGSMISEAGMRFLAGLLSPLDKYIVVHGPFQCEEEKKLKLIATMSMLIPEDQINDMIRVLKEKGITVDITNEISKVDDEKNKV